MAKTNSTGSDSVNPETQYTRWVILDWNVIHYWISEKMRSAILPVLLDMNEAKLRFAMSEISIYEAQCRMPIGKHMEAHQFMDGIPHFPIDVNTHLVAGAAMSCYKNHERTKGHAGTISLQDVFNASCAIQNGALLVTADYEDYPRPFFDEVWHWTISTDTGQSQKIYLLNPDPSQIENFVAKWNKVAEDDRRHKEEQKAAVVETSKGDNE